MESYGDTVIIPTYPPWGSTTVAHPLVLRADMLILPRLPIKLQRLFTTTSFPSCRQGIPKLLFVPQPSGSHALTGAYTHAILGPW